MFRVNDELNVIKLRDEDRIDRSIRKRTAVEIRQLDYRINIEIRDFS